MMNKKIGRISMLFLLLATSVILSKAQNQVPRIVDYRQLQERIREASSDTILVVNFWATWCKPCVEEMPILEKIPLTYKGIPAKVLLVNLDFTDQIAQRVLPFIKENSIVKEVLVLDGGDPNQWIPKVDPLWSGSIPACLFVYKKKSSFHEGTITPCFIDSSMNSLLP